MLQENRTYIIGDVHGQLAKLTHLLRDARLLSDDLHWSGGTSTLWFLGDFFDRGPDGLGAVDLVMRLEREAAAAGGAVRSLLGNHDALILGVERFGGRSDDWAELFRFQWTRNGGHPPDLDGLLPAHIDWLMQLPAMAHVNTLLLAHADSPLYSQYGATVQEVNQSIAELLSRGDPKEWDLLLERFSEHYGFGDIRGNRPVRQAQGGPVRQAQGGPVAIRAFLDRFAGSRLIHGHSPIHGMTGVAPRYVTGPHIYAHRLCVNVDGGMYAGGPGFVFEVPGDWR